MVYYVSFTGIKQKNETNKNKKTKTKTRQNKKRKKKERKKADKQNKQNTTPNIYIVPGVGLKDFIFLPKIVCKER
jgi:hypothetical protein